MSVVFPQGATMGGTVQYGNYLTIYSEDVQTVDSGSLPIINISIPKDSAGQLSSRIIGVTSAFGFDEYMIERNLAFSNDSSSILTIYTLVDSYIINTIGGTANSTTQSDGDSGIITYVTGYAGITIDWYYTAYVHLAEG